MIRRPLSNVLSAGALLLLLTGCANMAPPQQAKEGIAAQRPVRTYHDAIEIDGRLSLQYRQNGKNQSLHGNFQWSQTPQHTVITLRSILGQTLAAIDITPEVSTLQRSGQPARTASNVDRLVADTLGWPLPLSGLHQWLQGFATDANNQPWVATPQDSRTLQTRDGWRIRYVSWHDEDAPAMPARPKRIDLSRSTAEAGDVSLRIVIDNWQPR